MQVEHALGPPDRDELARRIPVRARVHRQDGFTFDAGPTIVTAPFLLEELWTLCGKTMAEDIDLRAMQPFYRIRFDDGTHFDYSGDDEAMKAEIATGILGDVYHARSWMIRRAAAPTRPGFIMKKHASGGPCIDIGVHILVVGVVMAVIVALAEADDEMQSRR